LRHGGHAFEWDAYLAEIKQTHRNKPLLMDALRKVGL
jgi:hypothetical protein